MIHSMIHSNHMISASLLCAAMLAGPMVTYGQQASGPVPQSGRLPAASSFRRVVTGKDASGKAIVLFDDAGKRVRASRELGNTITLLWVAESTPAALTGNADAADRDIGVEPPANGSIFRIVEYAPEKDVTGDYATRIRLMRERGIGPEGPSRDRPRHPGMHRTRTIDYAVILSGEIDMLLDDSEVHLKAGDVVVQRGTNHAWVNRGDQPCRVAFILIDGKD